MELELPRRQEVQLLLAREVESTDTLKDALDSMVMKYGVIIERATAAAILRRQQYTARRRVHKPLLTAAEKFTRFCFATRQIRDGTLFLNTCFTDESIFVMNGGRVMVYTRSRCDPRLFEQISQNPSKVMVFAGIHPGVGASDLYFHDTTVDTEAYIRSVDAVIAPLREKARAQGMRFYLQQDGAPVHTAALTRFLLFNSYDMFGPWPAHSPDLSPIEYFWALMKDRLGKLKFKVSTIDQLKSTLTALWEEITGDLALIRHYFEHCLGNCRKVADSNGDNRYD